MENSCTFPEAATVYTVAQNLEIEIWKVMIAVVRLAKRRVVPGEVQAGTDIPCLTVHKAHLHISRSASHTSKVGGHVSCDLSLGTGERRKITWVHDFPRVKVECMQ